ncbi:MAG: PP2C family protein-serine/threonine phosphatase [bacterium]
MKTRKLIFPLPPEELLEILRRKDESLSTLAGSPLLRFIIQNSQVLVFEPDEIILTQNSPSDSLFLILDGQCSVRVDQRMISRLGPGDPAGEMGLLLNSPRTATVTALETTHVLRIPRAVFERMKKNLTILGWIIRRLTERLQRSSRDAAQTLTDMEKIIRDQMELGRLQRSLLPPAMPQDIRYRLEVLYEPCAYAGGDYYDVIPLDDQHLFLIVADVTGHGAQASISMAIVRSFIHQHKLGHDPSSILKQLNRHLFEYGPGRHYVTAQAAVVDWRRSRLVYACAGHPPILRLHAGSCQPLIAPRAPFLRHDPGAEYPSARIFLEPGDRLAFYTDGILETFNLLGRLFNLEGIVQFMVKTENLGLHLLPGRLHQELKRFRRGNLMEDDLTFLVLECRNPGRAIDSSPR